MWLRPHAQQFPTLGHSVSWAGPPRIHIVTMKITENIRGCCNRRARTKGGHTVCAVESNGNLHSAIVNLRKAAAAAAAGVER